MNGYKKKGEDAMKVAVIGFTLIALLILLEKLLGIKIIK